MNEFLKDIFINIWTKEYSFIITNLILFIGIVLAVFGLIWLVVKCRQRQYRTGIFVSVIALVLSCCMVSFFVPEFYNFEASLVKCNCSNRNVESEKLAIKYALFPVQKGIYSVSLGQMYHNKWNGKDAISSYNKAHEYLGSYKPQKLWNKAYETFLLARDYDTVIKMGKDWDDNLLISYAYIMKHDDINALKYAKLALPQILQAKEDAYSLRFGYTYKILDHSKESFEAFKKAVSDYKENDTESSAFLKQRFEVYRKGEKMWEDEIRESYKL